MKKSAIKIDSVIESDASSSDESIYLPASDESQNGLHSGSHGNGNIQSETENNNRETNTDSQSSSENTINLELLALSDENFTGNGNSNGGNSNGSELLSDSDSASFITAPSAPMPLGISANSHSGPALAAALLKMASNTNPPLQSGGRKETPVEAACRIARQRNEIRHAAGAPRPKRAPMYIPPFRGYAAAVATSEGVSESTTSGSTTDVKAEKQPVTPLPPVLSKGSNAAVEIVKPAPSTDNAPPAKPRALSALAPEFIPIPRTTNQTYSSGVTGVPSHWIPLYGDAHGSFFDPATSMIVGDGPPRRTLHRPDGTLPAQSYELQYAESMNYPEHSFDGSSNHVQPKTAFTSLHTDAPFQGPGKKLYYCTCVNRWLPKPHNCYINPEAPYASGPIMPGQQLPDGWVDRDIPAVDTGYLETNMAGYMGGGHEAMDQPMTFNNVVQDRRKK